MITKKLFSKIALISAIFAVFFAFNNFSAFAASVSSTSDVTLSVNDTGEISDGILTRTPNQTNDKGNYTQYVYDFSKLSTSADTTSIYGLTISGGQPDNSMFKFSSNSGKMTFTTDKSFDITVSSGTKDLSNVTFISGSNKAGSYTISPLILTGSTTLAGSNLAAGTYTFGRSSSKAHIKTITIKVYENNIVVEPTGISVAPETANLRSNHTLQLTASLTPSGATGTISWSSNNESAATVDENGLVTALDVEENTNVTITASVDGKTLSDTCVVTVKPQTHSTATEYMTWDLTNGLEDDDNGNGLYSQDVKPYNSDGKYVQGSVDGTYTEGSEPTGAALKLVTDVDGVWNIKYKLSSGESKVAYLVKKDSENNYTTIKSLTSTGKETTWNEEVEAGNTYYFVGTSSKVAIYSLSLTELPITVSKNIANKAAIVKDSDKYYALAVVSADEVENTASLSIKGTGANKVDADTVYKSVNIGGNSYTAADFGGTASDYVYGVELTVTNNGSKATTAARLQDVVTVVKTTKN